MTDSSGDPHLDLDGLADHLAGEADARDHLSTCAGCTARLAELEAADRMVVAALRSLSDPPLPADVADRITAALRAEPPGAQQAPAGAPATISPATVTPAGVTSLTETRAARRRAWLPSVAAAAVLVAGGLLGYGLLQGGPGDEAASTTSAAAPPAADSRAAAYPTVASGVDYADPAAIAGALPGVLDGSAGAVTSAQAAPNPAAGQMAPSGAPEAFVADDPLARLRKPAALADCLATLLDPARPDDQPLALDYASYRGTPALAVVLPDADPGKVAVFVVGPKCSRADDDLAFFTRLNRP